METFKISWRKWGPTLAAGTLSLGLLTPAYGIPTGDRAEYDSAVSQAQAQYETAHKQCSSMKGQAGKICDAQARATEMKDKSDAEARYMGTDGARIKALQEHAKADYGVAREKCNELSGTAKSSCIKAAKERREKAEKNAVADTGMKTDPGLSTLPPLPSAPTGAGYTSSDAQEKAVPTRVAPK